MCECSIGMLRLLKCSLRSTMAEYRLNGLAMQYCDGVSLNPDEVEIQYAHCNPHQMLLTNQLSGNRLYINMGSTTCNYDNVNA